MTAPEAADVVGIQQLLVRFLWAADEGAPEDVAACFSETGHWRLGETLWAGPSEIAAGIRDMRAKEFAGPGSRTRHLGSNYLVEVSGDSAAARSCFSFVTSGDDGVKILAVGAYADVLERTDAGWRISSRAIAS